MALTLGNMITASEALALLDPVKAIETLKRQLHQTILSSAEGVTLVTFNVPKSISAAAVPILETEGYTVIREVLAAGAFDLLTIDWTNPTP